MNKALPAILLAVLGLGLGLLAWWVLRIPPQEPATDEPQRRTGDFKPQDFMKEFDSDGDGTVTLEEFRKVYGKPPLIFRRPDGNGHFTAEEAFNEWDRDGNGIIDRRDIEPFEDSAWEDFAKRAQERGLHPKNVRGTFLALNDYQASVWDSERGAEARDEVPFGGRYFHRKYLKTWAEVTLPDGERINGFVSEDRGKLWLLTPDAKLSVFDPDRVSVLALGDDTPQMHYARAIVQTPFDDPEANLELARKTAEWGMDHVARMLYARVLIFQPDHEAALELLGLGYDGRDHIKKEE